MKTTREIAEVLEEYGDLNIAVYGDTDGVATLHVLPLTLNELLIYLKNQKYN